MFRFRVVDRLPEPPSREALRGTLVHAVLEKLYDAAPHDRTEATAQELLMPTWNDLLAKNPEHAELFEGEAHLDEWLTSARTLVSNYFAMENPVFLQPAAREQFINARLPSGLAIRGIIDRIDKAPDGALRIVDYKTGKSPHPRYQDDALFQMRFYAAAVHIARGVLPKRTQLIYLKDGRTLTYDPSPQDVEAMIRELDSVWADIEARLNSGNFEHKKTPLCGWCHFQKFCPEFGGVPPQMSADGAAALRTAKPEA